MYIAVFIQPFPWSFYTASVFIGIAAAGKHFEVHSVFWSFSKSIFYMFRFIPLTVFGFAF